MLVDILNDILNDLQNVIMRLQQYDTSKSPIDNINEISKQQFNDIVPMMKNLMDKNGKNIY